MSIVIEADFDTDLYRGQLFLSRVWGFGQSMVPEGATVLSVQHAVHDAVRDALTTVVGKLCNRDQLPGNREAEFPFWFTVEEDLNGGFALYITDLYYNQYDTLEEVLNAYYNDLNGDNNDDVKYDFNKYINYVLNAMAWALDNVCYAHGLMGVNKSRMFIEVPLPHMVGDEVLSEYENMFPQYTLKALGAK